MIMNDKYTRIYNESVLPLSRRWEDNITMELRTDCANERIKISPNGRQSEVLPPGS
jgi:hypothetical protein